MKKKINTKNIIARTAGGMSFAGLLQECNNYIITDSKGEIPKFIRDKYEVVEENPTYCIIRKKQTE